MKDRRKPKVKLLTMWMLDQPVQRSIILHSEAPLSVISHGIWLANGAEERKDRNGKFQRIYTMVCVQSYNEKMKLGTEVKMDEVIIIELCHRVKLVHLPKYKSLMK